MNKIKATLIATFLFAPTLASVNAGTSNTPVCNKLTSSATGGQNMINASIKQVPCTNIISQLMASNQFPDVSYLGLCYVSNGSFNVWLGNKELTIQTSSAWTNSSDTFGLPFILGGTGYIGTVATQLTVSDIQGNNLGLIYTRDTINLGEDAATAGHEDDVIIAGTNLFAGAKGTIKLSSIQTSTSVIIETIGGQICTNTNNQNQNQNQQ
jgi:hypothetical protein